MKKFLAILLFLSIWTLTNAQTGNVWTFASNTGLDFNSDPPKIIISNITSNESCGSISDSVGQLLFYSNGLFIWNKDNNLIDSFYSSSDYDYIYGRNATILPTRKSNEYLIIYGIESQKKPQQYTRKFVSTLYKFDPVAKKGIFINKNMTIDTLTTRFKVRRSKQPGILYEIFGNSGDMYIYEVDTNNNIFRKAIIPIFRNGLNAGIEINSIASSSNYMFLTLRSRKQIAPNTFANDSVFFGLYSFDSNYNLKLIYEIGIDKPTSILYFKDSLSINVGGIAETSFSPNDSFIYLKAFKYFNLSNQREGILQWEVFNPSNYYFMPSNKPSNHVGIGFKLGPNGKIYSVPAIKYVSIINNPDIKGAGCNFQYDAIDVSNNLNNGVTSTNYYPTSFFIYQRVQFEIANTCDGMAFYNRSDTGIFKTFTWYFNDTDSVVQSLPHTNRWGNTVAVTHDFKTKGTYLVKLKGTKNSGYNVWWSNDIEFTPLKPKSKFSTQSTQGCQYVAYTFTDSSSADTVSPTGYSYYWNYGDGTIQEIKNVPTKIKSVTHTYLNSGTYTVRLIFSNGICSDTFSYINNVIILPAPKPGFMATASSWCRVPKTVLLTANTTANVVRYFYDMGNGDTISTSSAGVSYTYIKPGRYTIYQKILGVTGCITEDSSNIYIQEGLSSQDTVHVLYSTVIDDTTFTIWNALPHADSYLINNKQVKDTFYYQTNASTTRQVNSYIIRAMDSCQNQSASGTPNKTMLLKAENQNENEYALLSYTPYEFWKEGIDHYSIEVKNGTAWFEIMRLNNTSISYSDNTFLDTLITQQNAKEKCYRITAYQNKGTFISQSNETCVPFAPVVFVPTAFSPNGDGLNDYFKALLLGLNYYQLEVYNRWGELMYSSTNKIQDAGWDGTFHGEKVPPGIYVYHLISTSNIQSSEYHHAANYIDKRGTLMLVR